MTSAGARPGERCNSDQGSKVGHGRRNPEYQVIFDRTDDNEGGGLLGWEASVGRKKIEGRAQCEMAEQESISQVKSTEVTINWLCELLSCYKCEISIARKIVVLITRLPL